MRPDLDNRPKQVIDNSPSGKPSITELRVLEELPAAKDDFTSAKAESGDIVGLPDISVPNAVTHNKITASGEIDNQPKEQTNIHKDDILAEESLSIESNSIFHIANTLFPEIPISLDNSAISPSSIIESCLVELNPLTGR